MEQHRIKTLQRAAHRQFGGGASGAAIVPPGLKGTLQRQATEEQAVPQPDLEEETVAPEPALASEEQDSELPQGISMKDEQ